MYNTTRSDQRGCVGIIGLVPWMAFHFEHLVQPFFQWISWMPLFFDLSVLVHRFDGRTNLQETTGIKVMRISSRTHRWCCISTHSLLIYVSSSCLTTSHKTAFYAAWKTILSADDHRQVDCISQYIWLLIGVPKADQTSSTRLHRCLE